MKTPPSKPPRRRGLARLERVLWVLGCTALGWTGLVWADGALYQAMEGRRWAATTVVLEPTAVPGPSPAPGVAVPAAPALTEPAEDRAAPAADEAPDQLRVALPGDRDDAGEDPGDAVLDRLLREAAALLPERDAVGRLEIPRLGMSVIVGPGESHRTLARGAGLLAGSPRPGESGNVAVAAHRDRHFRPLEAIRPGDEILFTTDGGTHRYRVAWTRVVDPHAVEVLAPTAHPALTLVTCYPFRYVGTAPERFVVRAVATDGAPSVPESLPSLPL